MLPGTRHYRVGSGGGSSIADGSRNPTLPGWQRWGKLDRGCFSEPDVIPRCSDGCWPDRMFLGTRRHTRSWMLLGTRRYQSGSDGCWPDRMFLGTRRYTRLAEMVEVSSRMSLQSWHTLCIRGCFCCSITDALGTVICNWHTWVLSLLDGETRSAETKPGR